MTTTGRTTSLSRSGRETRTGHRRRALPCPGLQRPADATTLEQERLFSRAWCFLAHESEIRHPGDYVTRYIGNNNIIVARGEDGAYTPTSTCVATAGT